MKPVLKSTLLAVLLSSMSYVAQGAPDEDILGKGDHYPYPRDSKSYSVQDEYKVGEFSHLDKIFETRTIKHGPEIDPLPTASTAPTFTYKYQGKTYTLDDFLDRQRVTGLLVIKDGKIVVERYQYERQPEMRMTSKSMAKSITSMLIGIALQDGKIRSLDDPVEQYVPKLHSGPYGNVTIRNLLRMSSGVKWSQVYSPGSDNYRLNNETMFQKARGGVSAISWVQGTVAPQGTHFNYSAADSYVLGLVLQAAIGMPLADYMSDKLWAPMGAEDDASWVVDWSGMEPENCCFSARLRDYGRLGVLLANDGEMNGKQIVDREYLQEATDSTRQPAYLQSQVTKEPNDYGYQFWLERYKSRTFAMFGVYGQALIVQPESKIVMVFTSVWQDADNPPNSERHLLINAILKTLGGDIEGVGKRPSGNPG